MSDWEDERLDHQIIELLVKVVDGQKCIVAELAAIRRGEKELISEEVREIRQLRKDTGLLREIASDLSPKLAFIKLVFGGNMAQGPVILKSGQGTTASVLYFDTTGQPMPSDFVPPVPTYSIDHPEIASAVPNTDPTKEDVDFVSAGVANLTVSVTSAEGLACSDTETVTCVATVPPAPVLGSIKVDFSDPVDLTTVPPPPPAVANRRG